MIVARHPDLRTFLGLILPYAVTYGLISTGVCFAYVSFEWHWIDVSFGVLGTLGTALAIFLGFRNNSAYERWWEARKLWGQLVNASRSFARQATNLIGPDPAGEAGRASNDLAKELVYRQIAFVHALRFRLRRQDALDGLEGLIEHAELEELRRSHNPPNTLLQTQGERLGEALRRGRLEGFASRTLEVTLTDLSNVQGGCERIKNTPLPRNYLFFTRLFIVCFCVLLPLGLVESVGWWTVPLSVLLASVFSVLHHISELYEDPFENRPTDTPMTALSRTIEIDLREQLGESNNLQPLAPAKGYLL